MINNEIEISATNLHLIKQNNVKQQFSLDTDIENFTFREFSK